MKIWVYLSPAPRPEIRIATYLDFYDFQSSPWYAISYWVKLFISTTNTLRYSAYPITFRFEDVSTLLEFGKR